MVRVPAHSGEDVQELVRRIVSAVLEDHGAPEQDIEPLTHEVPGGATPLPVRLDNASEVLDRDAVDRGVAHNGKHILLEAPSPTWFGLSTAPRRLPRLDDLLKELRDGRRSPF